jgi:hypothetical protein
MLRCPWKDCQADLGDLKPTKEWDMRPHSGKGPALHVKHYRCTKCLRPFRIADKIQPTLT